MKFYFRYLPLALFFLIITGHTLLAAEHHVSTSAELNTALTTAQNNGEDDTILLSAGTYTGPFVYVGDESENYSLTIKPESGLTASQVVLDGVEWETVLTIGGLPDLWMGEIPGPDNAAYHIQDITFQNGCQGIFVYGETADVTISGNIIENNIFGECGIAGLYCQVNTGDLILDKNIIQGNSSGSSYDGTVYLLTNNGVTTVTDNLIQNNEWGGLKVFNHTIGIDTEPLNPVKIINNIIADNSRIPDHYLTGCYLSLSRAKLDLINNTICNNGGNGVYLRLLHSDAIGNVYNNIINDNELYDIDNSNTTSNHYSAYNNNYHDLNGAWETQLNNIDVNPKFVSPATGNYHLQSNSPCIDTGDNSAPSLPAQDFEGDTRKYDGDENGSHVADIGADEFVGPFPTCDGDFEPDGDVDGTDLDMFSDAYTIGNLAADLDNSGVVNSDDLALFAASFGKLCP